MTAKKLADAIWRDWKKADFFGRAPKYPMPKWHFEKGGNLLELPTPLGLFKDLTHGQVALLGKAYFEIAKKVDAMHARANRPTRRELHVVK